MGRTPCHGLMLHPSFGPVQGWPLSACHALVVPQMKTARRLTCRLSVRYCGAWTLNGSLTRLSSYRKCSKRRILGHSAQAIWRPRIGGTTKCSRTARGFIFGSGLASVVELSLQYFDYREQEIQNSYNETDVKNGEEESHALVSRRN